MEERKKMSKKMSLNSYFLITLLVLIPILLTFGYYINFLENQSIELAIKLNKTNIKLNKAIEMTEKIENETGRKTSHMRKRINECRENFSALAKFVDKTNLKTSNSLSFTTTLLNKTFVQIAYDREIFLGNSDSENVFYIINDSFSMRPTTDFMDTLIVVKPNKTDIHLGDVIIFQCKNFDKWILHRIVEVKNNTYITMGDNLGDIIFFVEDEIRTSRCEVTYEDIFYKVVGILYG